MAGSEFAVRPPHPSLRWLVTRYIGYRQQDVRLPVHRGLPSRHVTLNISLAGPVRMIAMPRPDQAPTSARALAGGLHTAPVLIAQDRDQCGIQLELNPLGTRALLGLPAAELSGYVVDLADLGPGRLATLPERLADAPGWRRRFAILDEVLRAESAGVAAPAPEIDWAWRRLCAARGLLRVDALAAEVGWSRRHFGERFRRELGLPPKQAARVLRFERAGELLRRHGRLDLAELAVTSGFYDQAHLTNEWRALAGCSPGAWIAEELPELSFDQETAGTAAADSTV
ncbi:AraC family transcriptional regulator [Amycolatopsis cihanbeyliensis]|uniref:Helix-turn-helix protein n=1 Tax=Amycolatopsis cihanbeyliensis TaxID=1128664 RepID=A0A542DGV3_AMYCI|nr:helix-turn-helix domain-containing protein [Amycolatopsis cihanbeyliensis]TQJ02261.1 helix-turn-helix protein [Amycolatopsis cihanbeyliensis]